MDTVTCDRIVSRYDEPVNLQNSNGNSPRFGAGEGQCSALMVTIRTYVVEDATYQTETRQHLHHTVVGYSLDCCAIILL
jgi:hypothetical protein